MSDAVATVNKVEVSKIRMTLIETWLTSASDSKQEDADTVCMHILQSVSMNYVVYILTKNRI
jgi:hypothetical protein